MTRPAFTRPLSRRNTLFAAPFLTLLLGVAPLLAAEPLHTNQPKFRIPFQFDPDEMARIRAVEIQLFVSTNRGRDWELAQSVSPAEAKFTFEAAEDAEYWFAVRTLDAANQRHPAGPLQPGLQVVIDRSAPEFQVRLRESAAGEVELTWNADDEYLDSTSLKLEFLDPRHTEWQSVAVVAAAAGRTSWTVPRSGRVLVRGSIADQAGNTSSAEAAVDLGTARPQAPRPAAPDFSQPVADAPSQAEDVAGNTDSTTRPSSLPSTGQPLIQPLPLIRSESPQIASQPDSGPLPDLETGGEEAAPEPATDSRRIPRVNTVRFHLNYTVDEVGPSGVGEVNLYITEDGGRKWYIYGSDDDSRSPFLVEVPDDGTYGFALRVESGVGLVSDPPQPGEAPEMSIIVDRRPPRAELLPIQQQPDASRPEVRIRWRVEDEELHELPVALYYAARASGPWEPITDWTENSGEYAWRVEPGVPEDFYIRLDARDAAGNVTTTRSDGPAEIDVTRPSGRIVDIQSITD